MPYQDIEDEPTTSMRRAPSAAERWTRKILFEDWTLKLLAIAITVALWMAVTGQNKPVMQRMAVQLSFSSPPGMEISNDPPSTIEVVLKGSAAKLDQVASRLVATVDISDQKAGERVVRLSQDRVQLTVPAGVSIESFRPTSVTVRLEPLAESQAQVEVKTDGHVAEGFEIASITVTPATVRLRGPADRTSNMKKVSTETVSLEGRRESFTLSNVAIGMSDPKIELVDSHVDVRVDIVEKKRSDANLRFASGTLIAAAKQSHPVYLQ